MTEINCTYKEMRRLFVNIILKAVEDFRKDCKAIKREETKAGCKAYYKDIREIKEFGTTKFFLSMGVMSSDVYLKKLDEIEHKILKDSVENIMNNKP